MKNIISSEIKRIINIKTLFILLGIMALNLALFYRIQIINGEEAIYSRYAEWDEENNIFDVYRLTTSRFSEKNVFSTLPDRTAVSMEYYNFQRMACYIISEEQEYINEYDELINSLVDNAERALSMEIYQTRGSFSRNNLLKTRYDFINRKEPVLEAENYKGYTGAMEHNVGILFSLAFMIVGIVSVFINDKKNNMYGMIRQTIGGRRKLAFSRVIIILIGALIVSALMEIATYVFSVLLYDSPIALDVCIQSAYECRYSMLVVDFGTYLILAILLKGLMLWVVSMVVWLVMEVFSSKQLMLIVLGLIFSIEYMLYAFIPEQSSWAILKYFNLISMLNIDKWLIGYKNVGLFQSIYMVIEVIIVFIVICSMVLICIQLILAENGRLDMRIPRCVTLVHDTVIKYMNVCFGKMGICGKELYKLLIMQRGLIVIVISVALAMSGLIKVGTTYSEIEVELIGYYSNANTAENIGEYTQSYMDELELWLDNAELELEGLLKSNNLREIEALKMSIEINNGVLQAVGEQMDYRYRMQEKYGIECGIVNQAVYEDMLGERKASYELQNAMFAVLAVIGISFGVFSYDRSFGAQSVINVSAKGRKGIFRIKVLINLFCVVAIWLIIFGADIYNDIRLFDIDLSEMFSPVQSIMFLEKIPFKVSIMGYIMLVNFFRLICMLIVMLVCIFISRRLGYLKSLLASLVVIIPYLGYVLGIPIVEFFSIINWMSGEWILNLL